VSKEKLRQILVSMFVGATIVFGLYVVLLFSASDSKADETSYLNTLANSGYTGPIYKWVNMGYDICQLEARGIPLSAIASKIVLTTGSGIYMADAYEIILITNSELCPAIGSTGEV
jgi:hypothetical protein